MTAAPRLLVVEGNTRESRDSLAAVGAAVSAVLYSEVLESLCPDAQITVLNPTDGQRLPKGVSLADFDGIAWTGSALNVYDDHLRDVRVQIDLMRDCFRAGARMFGSCWGLQVAAVAAGGDVIRNPSGREFGIARKISLTQVGLTHPMYRGKASVFEATAIHYDIVEVLPENSMVLASNAMTPVHGAEILWDKGQFWGVQYHPEFDLREIGLYATRYAAGLVKDGLFTDEEQARRFTAKCVDCQLLDRPDLRFALGVDDDILDAGQRLCEIANWLEVQVLPRCHQRG